MHQPAIPGAMPAASTIVRLEHLGKDPANQTSISPRA
jgi:hypothetical protein